MMSSRLVMGVIGVTKVLVFTKVNRVNAEVSR